MNQIAEKEKLEKPKKASKDKILVKAPTQERSRHTVAVILEACTRLLLTDGFYAITTDTIAQEAGVSVGSFYQFFGNKESVVQAVVKQMMEEDQKQFNEKMTALPFHDPEQRLRSMIAIAFEVFRREQALRAKLTSIQYYVTEPEFVAEYIRFFQEKIQSNLPPMPNQKAERVAYLLASALIGFTNTVCITNSDGLMNPEILQDMCDLFWNYLDINNHSKAVS